MQTSNRKQIENLALMGLFTALVGVLAYFGGFIKIGGLASISLTLIPVVLGGAVLGPWAGAVLGGVAGAVFFLTPDSAFWLGLSIPGTVITVMVKGILSGYLSGLTFRLLAKKHPYVALFSASVVCPVVNTGIFLIGCLTFFLDAVKEMAAAEGTSIVSYLILFFVGLNFVFELLANVVVTPALYRVLRFQNRK